MQPDLSFAPSGQARGLKAYWPMQKGNVAPRIAVAFSPGVAHGFWHKLFGGAEESSIRAGYGIYYDHYGEGIVNLFDQYGSFGLSESITNPTNLLTPGYLAALHGHSRSSRYHRRARKHDYLPLVSAKQSALDGIRNCARSR